MSNDHVFLCRSAIQTKETIELDGETYPVYKMEISNTSHPFYTGKMKLVDTAGRVDKAAGAMLRKDADKKARYNKQDFTLWGLTGRILRCAPCLFATQKKMGRGKVLKPGHGPAFSITITSARGSVPEKYKKERIVRPSALCPCPVNADVVPATTILTYSRCSASRFVSISVLSMKPLNRAAPAP